MSHCYRMGLLLAVFIWPCIVVGKTLNGFDLSNIQVPVYLVQKGGPPRDGIPSLDTPKFLSSSEAHYLKPDDIVLGIEINGEAKAYPLRILNWHEIVNDQIQNMPFVVSYCPLCGSGMAFKTAMLASQSKHLDRKVLTFGVSGLLYNSDVLMYDRETESLWSQIHGRAVAGKLVGTKLQQLPLTLAHWSSWIERYPQSLVLSTDTGYRRDYSRDPYAGYSKNTAIYFPVASNAPKQYHSKEMVLGFKGESSVVAFPFAELSKNGQQTFEYGFEEQLYTIHWDRENQSAWVTDDSGKILPSTLLFWFAWYAFYPNTEVFKAQVSQ
ncbi:DUF3179 domain-containing protein [Vibrio sp. ZSDZ34]|uniref:DUF3179 domain-containing protein n=1 Tax=Vibrio gelatinilyticus TaxID=2893468 RepID=A0A9X1W7Q9_9VIBR|nr:DUF3179 domain-containing protein [Vibrio gelatinilyticus]MCJ2375286.1 DUF3179 domain-containing protein [Vibrio gelatinilyticus]